MCGRRILGIALWRNAEGLWLKRASVCVWFSEVRLGWSEQVGEEWSGGQTPYDEKELVSTETVLVAASTLDPGFSSQSRVTVLYLCTARRSPADAGVVYERTSFT